MNTKIELSPKARRNAKRIGRGIGITALVIGVIALALGLLVLFGAVAAGLLGFITGGAWEPTVLQGTALVALAMLLGSFFGGRG